MSFPLSDTRRFTAACRSRDYAEETRDDDAPTCACGAAEERVYVGSPLTPPGFREPEDYEWRCRPCTAKRARLYGPSRRATRARLRATGGPVRYRYPVLA